jgi:hypothetical protein
LRTTNSGEQLQDGAYRLLSSFKSRVHRLFFDKSSAFENLPFAREAKPKEKKKKKTEPSEVPFTTQSIDTGKSCLSICLGQMEKKLR